MIFTDSSALSASFDLVRSDENLNFFPVMAENKLFIKSEKHTSIVFKEALSLLLAMQRCEKYIKSNKNTVLLFADAISLSQIQKLKNHYSKLYELSLLLSSFPNLTLSFLKGKYNAFADLMSRCVFNAVLSGEKSTEVNVASISRDVRWLMGQEIIHLSHDSLCQFLLNNYN